MHIMNSARSLTNFITNNTFKVDGVGGKDKGASASHVGDISLKLKGWTWFGDECTVNSGKGSDANPNSGRAYYAETHLHNSLVGLNLSELDGRSMSRSRAFGIRVKR